MDNFNLIDIIVNEFKININDIIMLGNRISFYNLYEDPMYLKIKRTDKINKIIKK